jgi:uncharacterized protein YbjT (DUF2867 family)
MIAVVGGTGRLGSLVTARLRERGVDVTALDRRTADVRHPENLAAALAGSTTVVSAITGFGGGHGLTPRTVDAHGNRDLIKAARAAGVEHFVLLSVVQASADHPIELFRAKHEAEVELTRSGLAWTIIRPTAYMETWVELAASPLLEGGRTRIFGRGANPINFVSVSDVARFVELAVVDPDVRGVTIEVGGPDDVTMNDLVDTFRSVTGASGSVKHVPRAMLRAMSIVVRPFGAAIGWQSAAALVMDTRDMTFDASERVSRYPSIPMTTLTEAVKRDQAAP